MLGQKEMVSYLTLNVTILRAKIKSRHWIFKSDCYVTLSLPTVSTRTTRTKAIRGKNKFEWNETFTFRVPSQLKNILEMNLFDKNTIGGGDPISTVYIDVTKLSVGKKETKVFPLKPETTDELVVEFELLPSKETPYDYGTNGILMAGPFSALHIKVDKSPSFHLLKGKVLKIKGAHPENQTIDSEDQSLCFHINRDLETELELASSAHADPVASIKLPPLPAYYSGKISLDVDGKTVDFGLEINEGSTGKIFFARIGYDIPAQEKEYLQKRKAVVVKAVEKLLGLKTRLKPNKVPTVAVVASGGGSRAMTGLFGSLKGLKELGVLDAVTYITGVSGSTWAMSSLYQEANWSQQDINTFISAVREHLDRSALSLFSLKELIYYHEELQHKAKDGYSVSADDLFGLICEQLIFQKKLTSTLSDQQMTVNEGQNPLPIYTAVNIKDHTGCETEAEWCEFTPYEVGLLKYGAFIQSKDLGSQFLLGHKTMELSQLRLPYLIGIWSSFFSESISEFLHDVVRNPDSLSDIMEEDKSITGDDSEPTLQSRNLSTTSICSSLTELLKDRPLISEMHNFTHGFFLRSNYDECSYFQAHKENHPDAFPNELTPSDTTLHMVDSGLAINIGCPPILRPERDVDIIISLNYSWEPEHMLNVLKKTAEYCKEHNIPFPNADFDSLEKEPKKEVYIFKDKENPKAPIVIHFPLVNVTYRKYKSPGVKRVTKEEIEAGKVDVESSESLYTTSHLCYSKENFDALVDLTAYNILNNRKSICEVFQKALQRRKPKIKK